MKQGSSGQLVQFELPLPEGPVGLKAWVAAHKAARPGNDELQKQVWEQLTPVLCAACCQHNAWHTLYKLIHIHCTAAHCLSWYQLQSNTRMGLVGSLYCVLCSCLCTMQQYCMSCLLLLLQLDAWVEDHEAAEAAKLAAQQAAMAEDGWTVVMRTKVRP